MRLWQWLMGTVRPISFLAWIPVIGGTLVGGTIDRGTVEAALGAMLVSSIANSLNNFLDRHVDRAAGKRTVAIQNPKAGYAVVIYLLGLTALILLGRNYQRELLAIILAISCLYSFVPNHLEIVKRLVVAGAVAATVFLDVDEITKPVVIWAVVIFGLLSYRETIKDRPDWLTDLAFKFVGWREALTDRWCLAAPLLAGGIFLASYRLMGQPLNINAWLGTIATSFAVISYLHIRAKHGRYRYKFRHTTAEGQLGLACSLTSAIPLALGLTSATLLIWNVSTMWFRSYLARPHFKTVASYVHDAGLWASVPLFALAIVGEQSVVLTIVAGSIFLITFFLQFRQQHT